MHTVLLLTTLCAVETQMYSYPTQPHESRFRSAIPKPKIHNGRDPTPNPNPTSNPNPNPNHTGF